MTFLEWRQFNIFETKTNVDGGNIKRSLGDAEVRDMSSGNGELIIGDSKGMVHRISRNFSITTFKAYQIDVTQLVQAHHSSKLITIGNDEEGINPLLKVWDLSKLDRHDNPTCIRISRCVPQNRAVRVTCLAVSDSLNVMAIGHQDGSIILFRGDIGREKSRKQKVLKDGNQPITGLAFRVQEKMNYLFVSTTTNVNLYNLSQNDSLIQIESFGCRSKCSVIAESADNQFMVARDDAIHCFTVEGKGSCFAIGGTKKILQWFRTYLVIVANDRMSNVSHVRPSGPVSNVTGGQDLTILDLDNKFIVYSAIHTPLVSAVDEWGSLFLLTKDYNLSQLNEKDLQSKLSLLFKKNLYDAAIRIAKTNHYDKEGLVKIFQQYGDHLYDKGDLYGAIKQYIKTIGKLEPSYVIRKFLDSQHIEKLTEYLAALHKAGNGVANAEHTTLLLNCYTKLNHIDQLKHFLTTKDSEVDFDVDVAIEVCRPSSSEDALLLAEKHGKHSWYLKIQIEDHARYHEALQYIGKLSFMEAEEIMKIYGKTLLENIPQETSEFLKKLCTDYQPSTILVPDINHDVINRAAPEDFMHFFLHDSELLVQILEYIINYPGREKCVPQVYSTLLEHYLYLWNSSACDEPAKHVYAQKILHILSSEETPYDKNQALLLCHSQNFTAGLLHLYKDMNLYEFILSVHLARKDYAEAVSCCRLYGSQNPSLWLSAFHKLIKDPDITPNVLSEILNTIEKKKLLSPLFILDALASSSVVNVGLLRNYFLNILVSESKKTQDEQCSAEKHTNDTNKLKTLIEQIESKAVIFESSHCSVCKNHLELPSIHFLCQHSFHKHCFQSFSENDRECPACLPQNKQILNVIQSLEPSKSLNEDFNRNFENTDDPFGEVAKYFGHRVFNKLTLVTDGSSSRSKLENSIVTQSKKIRPSGETETNLNPFENSSTWRPTSSNLNAYYDESKNPFAKERDYDESLNPFS